jgi:hypothetical protein
MSTVQQLRPRSAIFDEELERIRKVGQHNDLAYAAGLRHCVVEGIEPPLWLLQEIDALLTNLLTREKPRKRGRHAGRIARYRQDMRDFSRWCAVDEVRRHRQEYKEKAEEMSKYSADQRRRYGCIDKIQRWFKYGTFRCAAMSLLGTEAFASPDTVRASYRRVERRMRSPAEAFRYYVFWGDFLHRIGMPWPGSYSTGMKFTPFYDLKP